MTNKQISKNWFQNKDTGDQIVIIGTIIIMLGTVFLCIPVAIDLFTKTTKYDFNGLSFLKTQVALPVYTILLIFLVVIITYTRLKRKYIRKKNIKVIEGKEKIQLQITTECSQGVNTLSYPLKLYFYFKNNSRSPIALDNVVFEVGSGINDHPKGHKKAAPNIYKPDLLLKIVNNTEIWIDKAVVIEPNERITIYIPIENNFGKQAVEKALTNKTAGKLSYRCTLLDEKVTSFDYIEFF